jgi:PKHD-type hydroxylase
VVPRLGSLISRANQHYRFELRGFLESIQVAQYGAADFFDWHIDLGRGHASLRKVSITIQLSDPGEYDGGELEFQGMAGVRQPRTQGTGILFPSFLGHRVTTITRGTRYSMVAWASGSPFK